MQNLKLGMLCLLFWTIIPRLSKAEGFLYLPINRTPVITAGFCGYRTASGGCHGGIDYDTRDDGDEITAADGGVVEAVSDGWRNTRQDRIVTYGNSVRVRHPNGYLTIYGHLKSGSLTVRVGDSVRVGRVLGIGDNSGWSTGSHLHFEVRDPAGRKVDPYGDSPRYPNCGANALWAICPPVHPALVDQDRDGWNMLEDCDDGNNGVYPGATEFCNRRDENCDTIPDDRWAFLDESCAVEPIPGCVRNGIWDCTADETSIYCTADAEIRSELCNGLDDDCDTETDEDWRTGLAVDLGAPCTVGRGECLRSGVFECTPDGRATICGAEAGAPSEEYCDGLDNDCDGRVDDSCSLEPVTVYCCDGYTYSASTNCVQISTPSVLIADWDATTCEISAGRTPPGVSCSSSRSCAPQRFFGVCNWDCTSHAGFCLNDAYRSYCTKQCVDDGDCPSPLVCRATNTLLGVRVVYLCRD